MIQARVRAHIYTGPTTIDLKKLTIYCFACTTFANMLDEASRRWKQARPAALARSFTLSPTCPFYSGLLPGTRMQTVRAPESMLLPGQASPQTAVHTPVPLPALFSDCDSFAASGMSLARHLENLADKMQRAYGAYSHAEQFSTSLLGRLVKAQTTLNPLSTVFTMTAYGLTSTNLHLLSDGMNPVRIITDSSDFHQSFMSGLGKRLSFGGTVNDAATGISQKTEPLTNLLQGNKITITSVTPSHPLSKPKSISDCLKNQEKLGRGQTGTSYGTVVIQRFTTADGKHNWLVTIPGTDGKKDSPFGWTQNVDLMSSQASQRAKADSARYVIAAMKKAGIKPGDSVALAGHSQGGIIAATIASDLSHDFTIKHVITAGSPIANHPVPQKTWMTSTEVNDELVSSLDGKNNAASPHHLTVRGSSIGSPEDHASNQGKDNESTAVDKTGGKKELTHGLNYHRATWDDAQKLHSDAVTSHDKHFQQTIAGRMDKQYYFQGRMGR